MAGLLPSDLIFYIYFTVKLISSAFRAKSKDFRCLKLPEFRRGMGLHHN